MFSSMDLSVMQDVFQNVGGKRNACQIRLDITNFGNLLNHNWGVSQRLVASRSTPANGAQILTNPGVDAQGRATYRLAVVNNELITKIVPDDHATTRRRLPVHAQPPLLVQLDATGRDRTRWLRGAGPDPERPGPSSFDYTLTR